MKRYRFTVAILAAVVGCIVSASAQSGTQSSTSMDRKSGDAVTVTGCVQNNDSAKGSPSSATAGAYILANAMSGSTGGGAATGTSATGAAAMSSTQESMGKSYVLDGHDSDLKKHVGHRVEVTGMVSNDMGAGHMKDGGASAATPGVVGGSSSTGTTGTTSTTEASKPMASGHADAMTSGHLHVSSIRMISSDCAGPGR